MCGIAGSLGAATLPAEELDSRVQAMARTLAHRGPDHEGTWVDAEAGVSLGSRRLAVVGLSAASNQPMASAEGRYVIAYNGEITNFRRLARELGDDGWQPRGGSDTEVLLRAVERWGITGALQRCTGMFAFAIWDRRDRTLTLARDRMGERPLYYGWCSGTLLFGSELKALRAHPDFDATLDTAALAELLRLGYIPGPRSAYRAISKLPAGTTVTITHPATAVEPKPYWSLREVVGDLAEARLRSMDLDRAVSGLSDVLERVVADCMVADVPVGAFLSGGTDSALIVSMMQSLSSVPVRTFTIGFDEAGYDESSRAAAVAKLIGTDHTELRVTPADAMAVIDDLPHIYDEPFADSSQIPTVLLSRLARQDVTVAVSGDGGDELFGGYERYRLAAVHSRLRGLPMPMRTALARGVRAVPDRTWERLLGEQAPIASLRFSRVAEKRSKLADALDRPTLLDSYDHAQSLWPDPTVVLGGASSDSGPPLAIPGSLQGMEQLMYADSLGYLPDDILVKVDRAALAASLETRIPLLDHRVVEYAWSLPLEVRAGRQPKKRALRALLDRRLPSLPPPSAKTGFGVPIGAWLRGPLTDWAETLLASDELSSLPLQTAPVQQMWSAHKAGRMDASDKLWPILMLASWRKSTSTAAGPDATPRESGCLT